MLTIEERIIEANRIAKRLPKVVAFVADQSGLTYHDADTKSPWDRAHTEIDRLLDERDMLLTGALV